MGPVQEITLVVFYTRMPRETVRKNVEWSGDTQEILTWSKLPLQYRKWKTQIDGKAWTVQRPVLRLKLKIPCLLRARWKISSCDYWHHPVSRGYKSGNRCIHGYRCLFRFDMLMVRRNPARGREKKLLKDQLQFWKKKKKKKLRIERFGGTHHEILGMHLVQNWIRERKKQSGGWTSWAKFLARPDFTRNTWGTSSERANSDSEGGASEVETQKRKHSIHAYLRKNQKISILQTEKYGDLTTAEHKILNEGCESRNNHRHAVVVQVLASQWNPYQTKTSQKTEKNLRKFTEAVAEAKSYSYEQFIRIWHVL